MSVPLRPEVRQLSADGDTVIVFFDARGTARDGKPTGVDMAARRRNSPADYSIVSMTVTHGPFVGESRADLVRVSQDYTQGRMPRISELRSR
jgi:hypothetical protein